MARTKWIIAVGLPMMVLTAGAFGAPLLYFDVTIDSVSGSSLAQVINSKTANVGEAGDVVTMSVWAYVLNANPTADDGFMSAKYGIMSSTGGLLGDLSSALAPDFDGGTGALQGQNISIDGDLDLDVGGLPTIKTLAQGLLMVTPMTDVVPAYDFTPDVASRTIDGSDYAGWKMSTLTFTVSAGQTIDGAVTDILFMAWYGTATVAPLKFNSDGTNYNLKGDNVNVAVGDSPQIMGVPEPMTMVLLTVGGAALALRRRKVA